MWVVMGAINAVGLVDLVYSKTVGYVHTLCTLLLVPYLVYASRFF
jgi:hypothetical protein